MNTSTIEILKNLKRVIKTDETKLKNTPTKEYIKKRKREVFDSCERGINLLNERWLNLLSKKHKKKCKVRVFEKDVRLYIGVRKIQTFKQPYSVRQLTNYLIHETTEIKSLNLGRLLNGSF